MQLAPELAKRNTINLNLLRNGHVAIVGGKSASLGELLGNLAQAGVRVPHGFSTTVAAYHQFIQDNGIFQKMIELLGNTDAADTIKLSEASAQIRGWIMDGTFGEAFISDVEQELKALLDGKEGIMLIVRSSATAEDSKDASFAGQQESPPYVLPNLQSVLHAIKEVFASLFEDRAITYRRDQGFGHHEVAICAVIQQMVQADKASAGVMTTIEPDSNHTSLMLITAAYGFGGSAVGGSNTDSYIVRKAVREGGPTPVLDRRKGLQLHKQVGKPGGGAEKVETTAEERSRLCLNTTQLEELARFGMIIEKHYGMPMDIEWSMDGATGLIYIVQARPITTFNPKAGKSFKVYTINPGTAKVLATGLAVGTQVATGHVRILKDSSPKQLAKVKKGDILVAEMTDPNYTQAIKLAGALVCKEGSPICHAALVAREGGKPAVVGSPMALKLRDGDLVTVSCAEGREGKVYRGAVPFHAEQVEVDNLPALEVKIKMNVGDPSLAPRAAMLPSDGVGLMREEFVALSIGIHPMACIDYDLGKLSQKLRAKIKRHIGDYESAVDYYVDKLSEGIGLIAAAFWPRRVILRLSDFKTNEYRGLLGGDRYEKHEENPMIGFRGASRYLDPSYRPAFDLELRAIKRVIGEMELGNLDLMVPFVRTVSEGKAVIQLLAEHGLVDQPIEGGMRIGMMCELPSNVVLAKEFAKIFAFASIGSNDLTQLTLGLDRDSGMQLVDCDERNDAVMAFVAQAIEAWTATGKPIGICGQAPSQHPGFAEKLIKLGIDSMSFIPDTVIPTRQRLAQPASEAVAS